MAACPAFGYCTSFASCAYPAGFLDEIPAAWIGFTVCLVLGVGFVIYGWQLVRWRLTPCSCVARGCRKTIQVFPEDPERVDSNGERTGTLLDQLKLTVALTADSSLKLTVSRSSFVALHHCCSSPSPSRCYKIH